MEVGRAKNLLLHLNASLTRSGPIPCPIKYTKPVSRNALSICFATVLFCSSSPCRNLLKSTIGISPTNVGDGVDSFAIVGRRVVAWYSSIVVSLFGSGILGRAGVWWWRRKVERVVERWEGTSLFCKLQYRADDTVLRKLHHYLLPSSYTEQTRPPATFANLVRLRC